LEDSRWSGKETAKKPKNCAPPAKRSASGPNKKEEKKRYGKKT